MNKNPTRTDKAVMAVLVILLSLSNPASAHPDHAAHTEALSVKGSTAKSKHNWKKSFVISSLK